jgi:rubrerythrin
LPRKRKGESIRIKKYIAKLLRDKPSEICNKDGKVSPTIISKIVSKDLNLSINRNTVAQYLKEDLEKYLEISSMEHNEQIIEYNELMKTAKEIWDDKNEGGTVRAKAMHSYLRAKLQKEKLQERLMEESLKQAEVKKPTYLVTFRPASIKTRCPKCGHVFYDIPEKDKSIIERYKKKQYFKSGNGQSTLYGGEEKNESKK